MDNNYRIFVLKTISVISVILLFFEIKNSKMPLHKSWLNSVSKGS